MRALRSERLSVRVRHLGVNSSNLFVEQLATGHLGGRGEKFTSGKHGSPSIGDKRKEGCSEWMTRSMTHFRDTAGDIVCDVSLASVPTAIGEKVRRATVPTRPVDRWGRSPSLAPYVCICYCYGSSRRLVRPIERQSWREEKRLSLSYLSLFLSFAMETFFL